MYAGATTKARDGKEEHDHGEEAPEGSTPRLPSADDDADTDDGRKKERNAKEGVERERGEDTPEN